MVANIEEVLQRGEALSGKCGSLKEICPATLPARHTGGKHRTPRNTTPFNTMLL